MSALAVLEVTSTGVVFASRRGEERWCSWIDLRAAAAQPDQDLAVPYSEMLRAARALAFAHRLAGWCIEVDTSDGPVVTSVTRGAPPAAVERTAEGVLADVRVELAGYDRAFGREDRARGTEEHWRTIHAYGEPRIVVVDADEIERAR